jgi:hypothetical protein
MGRHAALVPELEALAVAHPRSERLLAQLMLALHRSGRSQDALAAFATSVRRCEPGPALRSLEQAIRDRDPQLLGAASTSSLTVVGMPVIADPPAAEWPDTVVEAAVTVPARRRVPGAVLAGVAAFLIGSSLGVVVHHLRTAGPARVRAAVRTTGTPPATGAPTPTPAVTPAPPATTVAATVVPGPRADTQQAVTPPPHPPAPSPRAPVTARNTPPTASPAPASTPSVTPSTDAAPSTHSGDRSDGWDAFRHALDRHDDDGDHHRRH